MNPVEVVESVVADQLKPEGEYPVFSVGDTLNVHVRIIEGGKERIQVYQGVLIAMRGRGINRTIMVRRIVANEGVERIFPLHSPRIAKIEVVRRGDSRRAKLYFLREREGKKTRLVRNLGRMKWPRSGKGSGLTKDASAEAPAAE